MQARPGSERADGPGEGPPRFVVAVGASAGGLEALERFFQACPVSTGAAFVVVQHLSPDHKSLMPDLLARQTRMPVVVVGDGMPVSADRVYLIPPGSVMRLVGGRFRLTPKQPHLLTLPIDIFLGSLAEARGSGAVAVILSGTGSDGSRGAAAINAAGGLLLAQDPLEARFDGMPRSVIATGLVDAVLPAGQLAERIVAHLENLPFGLPAARDAPAVQVSSDEVALEGILQQLRQVGGIDFHDYKPATVLRRIERRMQVRYQRSLADYLTLLALDRAEVITLRRELLIPVTRFFRDTEAFQSLYEQVVLPLVRRAEGNVPIRVWVAGCSTGEEAYSIAMLFLEAFEVAQRWPGLKVFATDVNPENIEFAAAGQYPDAAAAELPAVRLERFFQRTGDALLVRPELRQCIVFARHNLLEDPPFTRMSLVSCRNTLIYFAAEAQRRALKRMQYAILPEGYLFLGSSESLADQDQGFLTLHARYKLYQRSTEATATPLHDDGWRARSLPPLLRVSSSGAVAAAPLPIDTARAVLLDDYVPPSMLVNGKQEILHLFGDVSRYFQGRAGAASLALNRVLPEPLAPVAAALLFRAAQDNTRAGSDWLPLGAADSALAVRLVARPLPPESGERCYLLSFESREVRTGALGAVNVDAETLARVAVLERELRATRESLQATIEELETSNEELQATNEELMASNEELQSSNEELQSVNEELNTVNAEFQEKMSLLNRVNADLDTMAKVVGVATVFVDDQLHLTRFSPDATQVFKLRQADIGRPLGDIAHVLKYPELLQDLQATLETARLLEREALASDGRAFLVRILPYAVPSSQARGAVATFVDITAFHDRQRLQCVLDALPEHVAVLDAEGTIVMVNAAWNRFARANGDPHLAHAGVGVNYLQACGAAEGPADRLAARARLGLQSVLEGTAASFSLQYPCHSPEEQRWFVMNVAPIQGQLYGAVVSHVNITPWLEHTG